MGFLSSCTTLHLHILNVSNNFSDSHAFFELNRKQNNLMLECSKKVEILRENTYSLIFFFGLNFLNQLKFIFLCFRL